MNGPPRAPRTPHRDDTAADRERAAGRAADYLDPRLLARRLLAQRSLTAQLVKREIQTRYRGSLFGLGWVVAQPALLLGVYTLVFGVIFQVRWPRLADRGLGELAAVLFCGLIVMNLFNECVGRAPGLILGSPGFVKKVVFPLEILPVVALGTASFHAAASLAVLLVARVWLGGGLGATLLLAPLVLLPLAMLVLGLSWLLASLGVFVRDLGQVIQLALQALIFLTPVFYPLEALPERLAWAIRLNPLTPAVENLRAVVIFGQPPDWRQLAVTAALGALVMQLGFAWFARTRRAFADVV